VEKSQALPWGGVDKIKGYQSAKGIMEAQQWCDNFDNRKELAEILSANYFNLSADILAEPFQVQDMGDGRVIDDKSMAAYYWKDEKVASLILQDDLWFLTESVRWGFCLEIR